MRFACLFVLLGGCLYWDQGHGGVCNKTAIDDLPALSLVNPDTLQCQAFSGSTCDPKCGLCPAGATADLAPAIPSWGNCGACQGLDEAHCVADASCRPARDWNQYYTSATTDYVGCFPNDNVVDTSRTPCAGRTAQSCTQSTLCTALYEHLPNNCATCPSEQFKECIPKDQAAGTCTGAISCNMAKPTCPTNTTAGIKNGCWTGSCIPDQFCPLPG